MRLTVLSFILASNLNSNASILNIEFEAHEGFKAGLKPQVIRSLKYSSKKLNIYAEESTDGKIKKSICEVSSELLAASGIDLVSFMKLASEKESNARINCIGDLNYAYFANNNGTLLVVANQLEILIGE